MARSTFVPRSSPFPSPSCYHPIMTRRFVFAHKRSMSTAIPPHPYDTGNKRGTNEHHAVNKLGSYHRYEPMELYRSGGYHPVHLGDILQEGRYSIVHKLGWALDGTIWLARDRK